MRMSQLFLRTLRDDPADAEVDSHRLLVRAGFIRRVASGVYSWLPLGNRVLRKVAQIVREEMDAAGAQELWLPILQPLELWERSGRNANMNRESCWRESVSTFSSIAGALSNWTGSAPMNVAISAWINKGFLAMPW